MQLVFEMSTTSFSFTLACVIQMFETRFLVRLSCDGHSVLFQLAARQFRSNLKMSDEELRQWEEEEEALGREIDHLNRRLETASAQEKDFIFPCICNLTARKLL
jgi:hypothetical protein